MLSRVLAFSAATLLSAQAAMAGTVSVALDSRMLLLLGITLGIIAFAAGTAIICVRATQYARRAEREAANEAERYRLSENALDTVLAAEPQMLLTVSETGEADLLVATLPASHGVPDQADRFINFAGWLDAPSVKELDDAIEVLAERGEAFNLMLTSLRDRYVEVDGRATGRTIVLKVRDVAGQRLEAAELASKHRRLEEQVASLRDLLEAQATAAERGRPETKPALDARFRSFDRLATAFAVFDGSQRLTHFNQAYVALWQLDPEWLATHPRDGEILDRLRQARRLPEKADYREWKRSWLSSYGTNAQIEDQWHLPDGSTLHVIADSEGVAGVTYLYENVTERIGLESRYNALIQVQRETIETLREGVAVFAPNGRLRLYNEAFANIWRLNPHQLDGEPHIEEIISWCRALYDAPEEWERTKAAVTALVAERAYESEFDRPDGSVLACAALPLPDGGTLLTYVDVSDAKRAERALIERTEALEAADRLKTAFISHVSYELRTPLTNIIGFSELLASPVAGPLTDRQRDYLNDIRLSGRTLLSIIDDILDLATIDAGTLELKLSPLKVRDVVGQAVQGVEERLKQNDIHLAIGIEPGVDSLVADGRRVTQMLYNLLSNAIGFSEQGGRIALNCGRENSMLAFTVEDQGVGIPEDYQQVVFNRFESRSHGSRHRGAGLGLSVVKSLAELHGGTVSLDSAPGRGTRVKVLLPLGREKEAELEQPFYKSSRAG